MKELEVLKFINSSPDWEKLLAAAPYYLKISHDGDYALLSYNMLLSDMSLTICQECRGLIIRKEGDNWIATCIPFFKFFNATEPYSALDKIDWSSAKVLQKVDGSLIKFWYDRGEWHISTNGAIDAQKAMCNDELNFYQLVEKTVDISSLYKVLNRNYTYMFELTTPFNKIVIQYEGYHLWYLGRRNNYTLGEDNNFPLVLYSFPEILIPKQYDLYDYSACVNAAKIMNLDEEGYVVVDKNFNRVKIKGEAYLAAHRIRGNGSPSTKHLIELWQNNSLDDFAAICPEYNDRIIFLHNQIIWLNDYLGEVYRLHSRISCDRKFFALSIQHYDKIVQSYCFAAYSGKYKNVFEFLKVIKPETLADYIKNTDMQDKYWEFKENLNVQ